MPARVQGSALCVKRMKNYLNYQSSEYDCGPVSVTNGLRYLFEREEIPPDLVKSIMLYCLDAYDESGEACKKGTSHSAMMFLANWFNQAGIMKNFPIHCEFLLHEQVEISQNSKIMVALQQGGAVVLRLMLDVGHYVLLTGIEGDSLLMFDPYYEELDDPNLDEEYKVDGIEFILDQPKKANRKVSLSILRGTGDGYYEMGPVDCREALIMFNKTSQLCPENSIDYII